MSNLNVVTLLSELDKYVKTGSAIKDLDRRIIEAQPGAPLRLNLSSAEAKESERRTVYRKVASSGEDLAHLEMLRDELLAVLAEIGKGMFYLTLVIWLEYKRRAYASGEVFFYASKSEPAVRQKPIITLGDLIAHTSDDGTCSKRFHFLNHQLRKRFGYDSTESDHFPKSVDILDLLNRPEIMSLANDEEFARLWLNYETDKAGKWVNYSKEASPT